MYGDLKNQLRADLTKPRILKPQTERHLYTAFESAEQGFQEFLDSLADSFEDYEIEIIFGPVFTPSLEEQAGYSEALLNYQPDPSDVRLLTVELSQEGLICPIFLSEDDQPNLPLHEVMIDRYIRLLALEDAPGSKTAARIKDALGEELWRFGLAIARDRTWCDKERQAWLGEFLEKRVERRPWRLEELHLLGELTTGNRALTRETLIPAAESAVRSARASVANVSAGRHYLSSDVAEHHGYRGSGEVNQTLLEQKQLELDLLVGLAEDLQELVGDEV